MIEEIFHTNIEDVEKIHQNTHGNYEYFKRNLITRKDSNKCCVALYELPPGKAAYPYHFHAQNEEMFFITSGEGTLKTPEGERKVTKGDFMFFPANEHGAHKLTNTSHTEMLVYIDFDTQNKVDVAFYPDSNKIGIYEENSNQIYRTVDKVGYYEGE